MLGDGAAAICRGGAEDGGAARGGGAWVGAGLSLARPRPCRGLPARGRRAAVLGAAVRCGRGDGRAPGSACDTRHGLLLAVPPASRHRGATGPVEPGLSKEG